MNFWQKLLVFSLLVVSIPDVAAAKQQSLKQPATRDKFKLQPKSANFSQHQTALWQSGNFHLLVDSAESLQLSDSSSLLLILKANYWTEFARKLRNDPRTIIHRPAEFSTQLTLMELESSEELDELAIAAHLSNGFCGSLEAFPPTHRVYDLIQQDLLLPSYHSRSKFEGLTDWLELVDIGLMQSSIQQLEAFGTRFHASPQGLAVVEELATWFQETASKLDNLEVESIEHQWTEQKSVIGRLSGISEPDEVVILGAHLDSIAAPNPNIAPGADDNASGIASLLEVLRIINAKGARFHKTIELHAYGAEEIGLIGSRDLASRYRSDGKSVVGMMQIDMNHWGSLIDHGRVFLIKNHTSEELRRRAKDWLRSYITKDYHVAAIPSNASSDHKAWFDQGYPTLFAFENPLNFNPAIHSSEDKFERLNNPELSRHITQLALLFLIYSAGLVDWQDQYETQFADIFPKSDGNELFLAVRPHGDGYSLAISAPLDADQVEICPVQQRLDSACRGERFVLTQAETRQERRLFYYPDQLQLTEKTAWRVEAFNKDDELVAIRQVKFEIN